MTDREVVTRLSLFIYICFWISRQCRKTAILEARAPFLYIRLMNLKSSLLPSLLLGALLGLSLTGCVTEDLEPTDQTIAVAKGGTGGGGGGTTTPDVGAISRVSTAMTCDDGTVLSLTLDKGYNKQIEVQVAVAQAAPVPAVGYLTVDLIDLDSGVSALSYASWPSSWVRGLVQTVLGHQVTIGVHNFDFTAVTHEGSTVAGAPLVTCNAQITAVAR